MHLADCSPFVKAVTLLPDSFYLHGSGVRLRGQRQGHLNLCASCPVGTSQVVANPFLSPHRHTAGVQAWSMELGEQEASACLGEAEVFCFACKNSGGEDIHKNRQLSDSGIPPHAPILLPWPHSICRQEGTSSETRQRLLKPLTLTQTCNTVPILLIRELKLGALAASPKTAQRWQRPRDPLSPRSPEGHNAGRQAVCSQASCPVSWRILEGC